MKKVFGQGINFAAQLNSCRKKFAQFQQIQQLRNTQIRKLNCGYLQSYFLLNNGQVLKIGSVMDVLVNIRQINFYRLLPSLLRVFQKIPFLGQTLSFKGGHQKLTTLNMELLMSGFVPNDAQFGLSRMFLKDQNNTFYAIGQNYFGQLATNNTLTLEQTFRKIENPQKQIIRQIKSGFQHTCIITNNGNLYGCGKADSYQIQPIILNSKTNNNQVTDKIVSPTLIWKGKVQHVGCGFKHTVFSTQQGQVYSLGNNKYGQCGHNYRLSSQIQQPKKIFLPLKKGQKILDIQCGFNHSLILTTDHLYFFGCTQQNQNPFQKYSQNLSSPSILKLPFKAIKIFTNFDRIGVIGSQGQCNIFGGHNFKRIGGQSGQIQSLHEKYGPFNSQSLIGLGFGHTIICP